MGSTPVLNMYVRDMQLTTEKRVIKTKINTDGNGLGLRLDNGLPPPSCYC